MTREGRELPDVELTGPTASTPWAPDSRRRRVTNSDASFMLHPRPPFRLDLTVWALRRRPDNDVDRWDDNRTYRRVMNTLGGLIDVAACQVGSTAAPELRVTLSGPSARRAATRSEVAEALTRSLGLAVDLASFYRSANTDSLLGPLAERFRGLHPPRFLSLVEAMAAAVSCQQLSLTVGIRLLNRLTQAYGRAGPGGALAFPEAADLAVTSGEELRRLGYSTRKGHVLIALAGQVSDGSLNLDELAKLDDRTLRSRFCELDGIGRWSAEYIMLRGLGRVNVFPGDDVGARNKLARWLGVALPLDYPTVSGIVERWRPYAGLVYFHLLLDSLANSGWLTTDLPTFGPATRF
jgi:DNA-3-methyladenine glycosylase II